MAIASGVNLILSPIGNIALSKLKALSPDGRCKTFDESANGYVRSEGVGCIILKPLAQAIADKDSIYALIRGTAINHDGRSKGLTVPYGPAQESLIRSALKNAEIEPKELNYVELHGTGTSLGDPIEAMALGAVLEEGRDKDNLCLVGSVKSNIGHLEAAAGIASVIKMALSLKNKQIPPSLHFNKPNPYIPFDKLPLKLQSSLITWPQQETSAATASPEDRLQIAPGAEQGTGSADADVAELGAAFVRLGFSLVATEGTARALAAAGERVPVVLAFDGQHLTTSDIGTTLDRWLDAAVPVERLPVMCSACADLAGFHARGQWHGGSQTRNLTWDGARFARLDFEERLVPGMPLDLVQRYDALQLLLSMTRHLEPLGAGAVLQVLQAYARAGAGRVPDLRPFLQRLLPRLRAVLWLVGWSPRLRGSREARRLRTVLDGMSAFVADRPQA